MVSRLPTKHLEPKDEGWAMTLAIKRVPKIVALIALAVSAAGLAERG